MQWLLNVTMWPNKNEPSLQANHELYRLLLGPPRPCRYCLLWCPWVFLGHYWCPTLFVGHCFDNNFCPLLCKETWVDSSMTWINSIHWVQSNIYTIEIVNCITNTKPIELFTIGFELCCFLSITIDCQLIDYYEGGNTTNFYGIVLLRSMAL